MGFKASVSSLQASSDVLLVELKAIGRIVEMRQQVDETFAGAPAAVEEKKKQVSKALQYESYKERRDK